MLQCLNCGDEYFDDDLILINDEHKCYSCANNLRNLEINKVYNMDCQEGLKLLKTESVDLILTDPPYGISFMNKEWDNQIPSVEICKQMCRVLKSGAFAFVMMSPRQDVLNKMTFNLHEGGFEINFTSIYWVYGSGFPKAMNISKKVDDFLGIERSKIKTTGNLHDNDLTHGWKYSIEHLQSNNNPITQKAQELNGSYAGFQPKPAVEVIIVAMKPLNQENYIQQAIFNQKGITWLDDCRIPFENNEDFKDTVRIANPHTKGAGFGTGLYSLGNPNATIKEGFFFNNKGRFPANLLVSDDVLNDGIIIKGEIGRVNRTINDKKFGLFNLPAQVTDYGNFDIGSFSRYFSLDNWFQDRIKKLPEEVKKVFPFLITSKASSGERNEGLNKFEEKPLPNSLSGGTITRLDGKSVGFARNIHPTIKPLSLMSYLIILGSRNNDLVLDPFIGSGTTAIACRLLNRNFIGFEIDKKYHKIAEARLNECQKQKKIFEAI